MHEKKCKIFSTNSIEIQLIKWPKFLANTTRLIFSSTKLSQLFHSQIKIFFVPEITIGAIFWPEPARMASVLAKTRPEPELNEKNGPNGNRVERARMGFRISLPKYSENTHKNSQLCTFLQNKFGWKTPLYEER